tara:strand:- start:402 stop:869 length:468 start_codon:yes stop_codon:yes gene_type:complete
MKKYILYLIILFNHKAIFAHCQIPCGIYDDVARIIEIKEDLETIKKAMIAINKYSDSSQTIDLNQLNRWIDAKDQHASNIQHITSNYFLTQRIKPANNNYLKQLEILHQILISSMKCKQTVKIENVTICNDLVESFSKIYLNEHEAKHLKTLEKN